jgi:hypothetical protein
MNLGLSTSNLAAGTTFNLDCPNLVGGTIAMVVGASPPTRYLPLTDVKTDAGLPLATGTAATTLPGIARTAGTSMYLTGVATSGATPATTKMLWEFNLPTTYVAGANVSVIIETVVPTATDVTAASTTTTVAAYLESAAGVETGLTVSAAQQTPITTAAALTFVITGTAAMVPGARMAIEVTSLVTTTSGGASSMELLSIGYTA